MSRPSIAAVLDYIQRPDYDPRVDDQNEIDEYLRLHDLEPTEDQADD